MLIFVTECQKGYYFGRVFVEEGSLEVVGVAALSFDQILKLFLPASIHYQSI